MCDKDLLLDSLENIENLLLLIQSRTSAIASAEDYLSSPEGMLLLDAVCMNLIALGETVKGLNKFTNGELLPRYPSIPWSGVMRMRDKIAHHYFEIDAEVVFNTINEDLPPLLTVVRQMIADTRQD